MDEHAPSPGFRETSVTATLSVRNGARAVEFYKAAFGAEEIYRFGGTDDHKDVVCQLSAGGAPFWVEDESPHNGNFLTLSEEARWHLDDPWAPWFATREGNHSQQWIFSLPMGNI